MYMTEYVLQGFFAVLFVAMLIIFQEDLRRFFEHLAIWRPFKKNPRSVIPDVKALSSAVISLAQKRYGALIILKGKDYLNRHLEGGNILNGTISSAILESIFDPHSSGHDGAVIIEEGKISKFGCHLPLSTNSKKVMNLGLRHTAALGLAERCDALCIVVSEELGSISIARNANITRLKNQNDLKDVLEEFQSSGNPPEVKRWPRWLRENPWEKGVALLLGCTLWITFGFQTETIRRDFVIPIEYRNLPVDWIIENQEPKETTVALMGSKQAFDLLRKEDTPKLIVDMSNIREGKQEIVLSRNTVEHSSNLTVVGIQPGKLSLTAHQTAPVDVPIKVDTIGKLPQELVLKKIEVRPEYVKITAKKKSKRDIQVRTEPIDLASIKETTKITPRLLLPPTMEFTEKKIPLVTVTIIVEDTSITPG